MRAFIARRLIRFLVTFAVFQVALFLLAYVLSGNVSPARETPAKEPVATEQAAPEATAAPEFAGELEGISAEQLEQFGEPIPEAHAERGAAGTGGLPTAEPVENAEPTPAAPAEASGVEGRSASTGRLGSALRILVEPAMDILVTRAPRTVLLFLPATVAGFGLGLGLGKRIAWRRGGWLELGVSLTGVAFYTSFAPWLAFVLINIFALSLHWTPVENLITTNLWVQDGTPPTNSVIGWLLLTMAVDGALLGILWWLTRRVNDLHPVRLPGPPDVVNSRQVRSVTTSRPIVRLLGAAVILALDVLAWRASGWGPYALDMLYHLILPLATLTLLSFGETMLLMRTTMLETLGADHILTAYAKGLSDGAVRDQHVARLAVLPVLARFVLQLPFVLIGSLVIEPLFAWNGIGQALFDAAGNQELPVVIGILSVVGILALLAHPIVDILHAGLDPRVRDTAIRPTPRA